jgi:hypothetical protein
LATLLLDKPAQVGERASKTNMIIDKEVVGPRDDIASEQRG